MSDGERDTPSSSPLLDLSSKPIFPKLPSVACVEIGLLCLLMFVHGGDLPPAINEAHYLVKAKAFWNPKWCSQDLFVTSGKAHVVFDSTFGYLTTIFSLSASAWVGRAIGWWLLAVGLFRLTRRVVPMPFASLWVGLLWLVGVNTGNLAGEWVVGGIEAKVPGYGLLLIGLEQWLGPRPHRAWIWLGSASAFHVLVGGWTVIGLLLATFVCRSEARGPTLWRNHLVCLFAGGILSLLGLVPALLLNADCSPEVAGQAARIYTFERLSHHLWGNAFQPNWFVRFGVLSLGTLIAVWLGRRSPGVRRLGAFTLIAWLLAMVGLGIGCLASIWPDLVAKLLRLYWFRLADAVVPLGGAVAITSWGLSQTSACLGWYDTRRIVLGVIASCAVAWQVNHWWQRMAVFAPPGTATWEDPQYARYVHLQWLAVCDWVKENTPEDSVFLTPKHQQTFKWYTGRAEVVSWKDVPQDAKSLVIWSKRLNAVFPAHLTGQRISIRYDRLREFRREYGARYVIIDRRRFAGSIPLVKIYPLEEEGELNPIFEVYELLSARE